MNYYFFPNTVEISFPLDLKEAARVYRRVLMINAARKLERCLRIHLNVGHFVISPLDIPQRTLKAAS